MLESLAHTFMSIPAELATALLAALPVGELRAALPIGATVYGLPIWSAYLWAVIGNIIPVFFILWWIGPVADWLSERSELLKRFFDWLFDHTRKKVTHQIQLYGAFALILFVAIPLPVTGAWTGSLAAYLFKFPPRTAVPLIFIGILISGLIVTGLTTGALALF